MRKFAALVAVALPLSSFCLAQTAIRHPPAARTARPPVASHTSKPDVILFNGVIYTGVGFAEDQPQIVQAMEHYCTFEVINISTNTGTYIANGIRTHNKALCP